MPIRRLIYVTVATVIGATTAQAQQREAVLQQVDVANAGFISLSLPPNPAAQQPITASSRTPTSSISPLAILSTRTPEASRLGGEAFCAAAGAAWPTAGASTRTARGTSGHDQLRPFPAGERLA